MVSTVASQEADSGYKPAQRPLNVLALPAPGTLVRSHCPKTCRLGQFVALKLPVSVGMVVCLYLSPAIDWTIPGWTVAHPMPAGINYLTTPRHPLRTSSIEDDWLINLFHPAVKYWTFKKGDFTQDEDVWTTLSRHLQSTFTSSNLLINSTLLLWWIS